MALKYKICNSEGEVPQYVCDACAKAEGGSVRGVAYIHKSLQSAVAGEQAKTNLGKIDWWETQINAGLVFVIPSTRGTFDGGTKKVSSATWGGKVEESLLGKTFVLNVIDRQHSGNRDFYQAFENNARSYIPAFCSDRPYNGNRGKRPCRRRGRQSGYLAVCNHLGAERTQYDSAYLHTD